MSVSAGSSLLLGIELKVISIAVTREVTRFDPKTGKPFQKNCNTFDLKIDGLGDLVFLPDDTEIYEEEIAAKRFGLLSHVQERAKERVNERIAAFLADKGFVLASEVDPKDKLCASASHGRWFVGRQILTGSASGYHRDRCAVKVEPPDPEMIATTQLAIAAKLGVVNVGPVSLWLFTDLG